jgi:5'/3'-nucleotidase SurE
MRCLIFIHLVALTKALNIVSSNDDGWAEANIRQLYDALSGSGHTVVVSAPAENQSGAGMYSNDAITQPTVSQI